MITIFSFTFIFTLIFGFIMVNFLKKKQFEQIVRIEGPKSHQKKSGTPTIGGIIFLIPIVISSFIFIEKNYEFYFILFMTLSFATIGFIDDYLKIYLKRNLGLNTKQKILAQILISIIASVILFVNDFDTTIHVIGTNTSIDLTWFYFIFFLFLSVGTTNATNLTDGLDGLLSGLMIISFFTYTLITFYIGDLNLLYLCIIFISALFAFLFFNRNPAKVFMGDTGSLALGGSLVSFAIVTKTELLLAIIGGVFVIETLSVIIQVISFKITSKRIFKMTPIHHHFELSGWNERKVVLNFWIIGSIFSLISLYIFST